MTKFPFKATITTESGSYEIEIRALNERSLKTRVLDTNTIQTKTPKLGPPHVKGKVKCFSCGQRKHGYEIACWGRKKEAPWKDAWWYVCEPCHSSYKELEEDTQTRLVLW